MHWAYEQAKKLIEENPNREEFVCASGISPSGDVHIGNFREVLTTYFVVEALRKLGKKARFIFSWDDFDRFRKVPKGIPAEYEQYIGMPYSKIPDPFGCCESYAKHYENAFEDSMKAFGLDIQYIYQSDEYTSERYSQGILHAMENRKKIYDIIMSYKTSDWNEQEREAFYPIALYCHKCGKDHTTVVDYDHESHIINYTCSCGYQRIYRIDKARNIKLIWKVDWPMRWKEEGVIFEPGGKDHSSMGGSFQVATQIAKEIYDFSAPYFLGYEFINIKGGKGKMSSSLGNLITPRELLRVYSPQVILYIFLKNNPATAFNFGFDDEVIKNYTEFSRALSGVRQGKVKEDNPLHTCIEFSTKLGDINGSSFVKLAGILPLMNFNVEATKEVLSTTEDMALLGDIEEVSSRVEYWIRTWNEERGICILEDQDSQKLSNLSEEEQLWLNTLLEFIGDLEDKSMDEQMSMLYGITRTEDKKETRQRQNKFFRLLYELLIGQTNGPRLPILFKIIGHDRTSELLTLEV